MKRFKPFTPEKESAENTAPMRSAIRELDKEVRHAVREFEMRSFSRTSDDRFEINPFVHQSLTYEDEVRIQVEAQVNEKLKILSEKTMIEAKEKGFEQGKKEGFQESFAQFQLEATDHLKKIEKFVQSCEEAKEMIYRENEKFLIELIFRISQTVLLRELKMDREYLGRLVNELIQGLGVKESVFIKIHPEDAAFMKTIKEDLLLKIDTLKNVNVELNENVKLGGCLIETNWNAVDASVQTQLDRLHGALTGSSESAN